MVPTLTCPVMGENRPSRKPSAAIAVPAVLVLGLVVWLVLAYLTSRPDEFERFGEGWRQEGDRQVLAWDIHVAGHGEPPGYARWLEEDEERRGAQPEAELLLSYLDEMRDAPRESARSRTWEEILEITDQLRDEGDLGTAYVEWRTARLAEPGDVDPRTLVALYVEELDAADEQESAERRDVISSLLARSGAASALAPQRPLATGP